jgi:D-glycero-alpha-D-manno-heptose-7-phosphate kinase
MARQTLIARAPVRISLAGGGTDLPAYYERHGGLVISTTIDKFVYVHVSPNGTGGAQLSSADYQTFYHHQAATAPTDSALALPRTVLETLGVEQDVSIFVASEVPPGTGLGSSSAVVVALIRALTGYLGRRLSSHEVAELACQIELTRLQAPIGKQDQFASAYGGLNAISFDSAGVGVEALPLAPGLLARLERRLLLFFTGTARDSATILRAQQRSSAQGDADTLEGLHRIKATARACRACLEAGDLDGVGRLLDEGWRQKRRLAPGITTAEIDALYDLALASGALGGKITGAGGGGFLLLYVPEERQAGLIAALERRGPRCLPFRFEPSGASTARAHWDSPTR